MHTLPNNKGFTLIELVIIIILIGILAATVAPKFDLDTFQNDSEATRFLAHLRYAQHKSMVSGGYWYLTFDGSSYSLFDNSDNPKNFPDHDSPVDDISGITSDLGKIYFDYLGTPDNDANKNNTNTINAAVRITIGGQDFYIQPHTGGVVQ